MVMVILDDRRLDLMALLAPAPVDEDWEAEKAGWRCFVMGNDMPSGRHGSRLRLRGSAATTLPLGAVTR